MKTLAMKKILLAALALGLAACTTTSTARKTSDDGDTGDTGTATGKSVAGPSASEPAQPQINSKAKLLFEDANKAYDTQKKAGKVDYPAIEKKYQTAASADDRLAEATYNLGVLAERQGKTKEAIAYYKEALNKRPTLKQAAENLAVIAQNQGDESGAQQIYTDILSKYPEDASSRARLAEIHRRKGEYDEAVKMAKEALFREPRTLQAYKVLMLSYFEQKQFSMAKLVALRASKIEENDPEIFFTLGQISQLEKEPAKARVLYKRAVEARPDFLPAHLQLAKMALAQEDYVSAEESIRRILQANSKNPEALLNLGVAYKGMGQYDKAMAAYDAAHKLKPDMPEIYLNRGFVLAAKQQPEKALELYKQYIQMKGGAVEDKHPVYDAIKDQELVLTKRDEDKKAAEEAAKMEAEMKKVEEQAAAEEKRLKEEELKKSQSDAKGNAVKDAAKGADTGEQKPEGKDAKDPKKGAKEPKAEAKAEEPKAEAKPAEDPKKKKEEKKAEPAKAAPAKAAPAPAKGDEPDDAL